MCTICIFGALGGQTRALESLELDLWVIVRHHVMLETKPGSSTRALVPLTTEPPLHPSGIN